MDKIFLQEQGYDANKTLLKQDNMSTIRLIKNGKASSGQRTKHIDIKYFLLQTGLRMAQYKSNIVQLMLC